MSSIVLTGDTSGTITVSAPAVAGTRTLTLPAATGTVMVNGPAFSAFGDVDQNLTSNVATKILFTSELFDTNDNFASSRFTPTVAGYYQLNVCVRLVSTSPNVTLWQFYKNGSVYSTPVQTPSTVTASQSLSASNLIYMNGTTDYVEIYAFTDGTSPIMNYTSNENTSTFSGFLARGA